MSLSGSSEIRTVSDTVLRLWKQLTSKLKLIDLEVRSKFGLGQEYVRRSGSKGEQSGQLLYLLCQSVASLLPVFEEYLWVKCENLREDHKLGG